MPEIPIDDMINEMPSSRHIVAAARAFKACDIEHWWGPGGVLKTTEDLEEIKDREDFIEAFELELRSMAAADILANLEEQGEIKVSHIDAEGNKVYVKA